MREEWREIGDWYLVSNMGRMKSYHKFGGGRLDEPVLLTGTTDKKGYQRVVLVSDDGSKQKLVHILVLEAFVGPCPEGEETRHLDGNSSNNRLDNLEWGTDLENGADKVRHGTSAHLVGADNGRAVRPSDKVVTEIQKRFAEGESARSIAGDFPNLSYDMVKAVAQGRHWSVRDD